MKISKLKLFLVFVVLAVFSCFFYFDLGQYLSFEFVKSQKQALSDFYSAQPLLTIATFFAIYVISTGFSLPGATILTLASGYIFGWLVGVVIVSFASVLGASLAFLFSRFLFRDWIQNKFGSKLKVINDGIKKDGNFYLFSIRLIPAFPFFVVNLVMGLTPIKLFSFFWVSQLGMLPATIVYVNVGTQLSKLETLKGIVSPQIILSFLALAAFPWCMKVAMKFISKKRRA